MRQGQSHLFDTLGDSNQVDSSYRLQVRQIQFGGASALEGMLKTYRCACYICQSSVVLLSHVTICSFRDDCIMNRPRRVLNT